MSIPDDPYFAGRVATEPGQPKGPGDRRTALVLGWLAVSAVNLIVPVFFGLTPTSKAGWVGMFLGVLLLLGLGCRLVVASRQVGTALVIGGWVVAASQVVPLLQIIAGMIGLRAAEVMGQATGRGLFLHATSESGGFIATVVTGGILIGVALSIGLLCQWIRSLGGRGREVDPA